MDLPTKAGKAPYLAHQAQYYAHQLSRRTPANSLEKFAATLVDAQVDLNPHQVEAALFAFRSPLSKGAMLADEVGLGKTIEAGLPLPHRSPPCPVNHPSHPRPRPYTHTAKVQLLNGPAKDQRP